MEVGLHGDRFVADILDLIDSMRFRQGGACSVVFDEGRRMAPFARFFEPAGLRAPHDGQ